MLFAGSEIENRYNQKWVEELDNIYRKLRQDNFTLFSGYPDINSFVNHYIQNFWDLVHNLFTELKNDPPEDKIYLIKYTIDLYQKASQTLQEVEYIYFCDLDQAYLQIRKYSIETIKERLAEKLQQNEQNSYQLNP